MATIEDFVTRFHNLDGITIVEKQKSFRKLLNEHTSLLQDSHIADSIVKKITPQTHLEELLKLQVLLYCQRMPELLDIFTSGNESLIIKIMRHDWFIEKLCVEMDDVQHFLDNLLPRLSYAIRMKFLKKVSLHLNGDDRVYNIFEAVKHRYSLQVAMPLVLGCSVAHIESIIKNNPISFKPGQLRHFIKKAPELLLLYIEEYERHFCNTNFIYNNDILRYIANTDYNVFCQLKEKYKFNVNYGKRASKKIFERERVHILDNLPLYKDRLNKSVLVRKLGKYGHFKRYLYDAFLSKIENFEYDRYSEVFCLLQYYPKKKQLQLLEECFEHRYNTELMDCPGKITTAILDMVSDVNKREKMVGKIIELNDNIAYVVYLPTSKSIPFIKKEMNLSANNIHRRKELIKALVSTCKINNDWDALKDVLKYILVRHRNDVDILETFMTFLCEKFDPHEFTKDFWDPMTELITIYKLKEGKIGSISNILLTHLEFLYNNAQSMTALLPQYIKDNTPILQNIFSHRCTNYKFIQTLFPFVMDILPQVYDNETVQSYSCYFLEKVLEWNIKHPEHKILLENRMDIIESVKELLKKDDTCFYYDLRLLICRQDRNDEIMEITHLYWKKHLINLNVILYFLKWYPSFPKDYYTLSLIESLSHFQSYEVDKVFKWIRMYDHIQLPENILKCSRNLIEKTNEDNQHMVKYLARIMNPQDYIRFVDQYKPKKLSVDLNNEEEKKIYKLQCQIVESFNYIYSPLVLPQVLDYCGADFLKFALSPLYKCFYRIPEDKLNPFLSRLIKNSVSVRKHAVFLAAQVFDQETVKRVLKSASTIEKNPSLQKRLVLTTLNLFKRNASEDFWELFKYGLTFIDESDKETFEILVHNSYIPINYRLIYYEEVWNLTAKPGVLEAHRHSYRDELARIMKPLVKQLPLKFCINIIDALFLKYTDIRYFSINEFIYEFLLHHKDPERFETVHQKITNAKTSSLSDTKLKSMTRNQIVEFISSFCNGWIWKGYSKDWDQKQLRDFVTKLSEIYPEVEFFEKYVYLMLLIILIDLNGTNIEKYAVKISEFCQTMCDKYGPYVLQYLERIILKTMEYFENTHTLQSYNETKPTFVREYLKISKSELDYIIAFKIYTSWHNHENILEDILNAFKACTYPYIQIMLRETDMFSEYK